MFENFTKIKSSIEKAYCNMLYRTLDALDLVVLDKNSSFWYSAIIVYAFLSTQIQMLNDMLP